MLGGEESKMPSIGGHPLWQEHRTDNSDQVCHITSAEPKSAAAAPLGQQDQVDLRRV
jgi:hypothetical protein